MLSYLLEEMLLHSMCDPPCGLLWPQQFLRDAAPDGRGDIDGGVNDGPLDDVSEVIDVIVPDKTFVSAAGGMRICVERRRYSNSLDINVVCFWASVNCFSSLT
jgi:hypothetical protein